MNPGSVVSVYVADRLPLSAANHVHLPSGSREYLGMLEYKKEDEGKLIQNLILGSRTQMASNSDGIELRWHRTQMALLCFLSENLNLSSRVLGRAGLSLLSSFMASSLA